MSEPCDLDAIRDYATDTWLTVQSADTNRKAVLALCDELEATRVEVERLQTELAALQNDAEQHVMQALVWKRERDEARAELAAAREALRGMRGPCEDALRHLSKDHYPTYRDTWDALRTALTNAIEVARVADTHPQELPGVQE